MQLSPNLDAAAVDAELLSHLEAFLEAKGSPVREARSATIPAIENASNQDCRRQNSGGPVSMFVISLHSCVEPFLQVVLFQAQRRLKEVGHLVIQKVFGLSSPTVRLSITLDDTRCIKCYPDVL